MDSPRFNLFSNGCTRRLVNDNSCCFLPLQPTDATEKVFQAIRQSQSPQLLVVADEPHPDQPEDVKDCAAARSIIGLVYWDCQVIKNYADVNLGGGRRITSGVD